ncbi:MAG: flippase [Spartobacteria bacterium]|nr:flippase [Spartobacteria bacterium]
MNDNEKDIYKDPPRIAKVAGNTVWNLIGFCAPMVVALVAIPVLTHGLGKARFGALTLAWMLVGYFSIFDLGLGRALTKLMAEKMGLREWKEIPSLFWTALMMMLGLGLAVGAGVALFTPALAGHILNIPDELRRETLYAFYAVSVGLPVVISTTGLIGVLEANQRFSLINKIRIFTGSFTFLGPVCVLPFSQSLFAVVSVLTVGRIIECVIYFFLCRHIMPQLRRTRQADWRLAGPLLRFGGWMTVSTLALPLMAHIDRFIIGSLITMTAVAYYTIPAEIVIKLLILPRALVSVLFPTISAQYFAHREETEDIFGRCVKYLLAGLFPLVLGVVTLAPEGLWLWLGKEYMLHSASVMRLLIIGVYLLSMSYLPYTFLQGIGRPDLPAKLHIIELPLYLALSYYFTKHFGIQGAATAWIIRAGLDVSIMYALAMRFLPHCRMVVIKTLGALVGSLALLAALCLCDHLILRVLAAIGALLVMYATMWFILFTPAERAYPLTLLYKHLAKRRGATS